MRQTHGVNFLASYTYGHAMDHVSGLNIGGESRPVLPVTIGDRGELRSRRWRSSGATRCSTCATASWSASARSCRRRTAWAPSMEHVVGGWQLNGIVQKQTGFPLSVTDSALDIRFLTNRPDAICDPNDGRAAHHRRSGSTRRASSAARSRPPATGRATPAGTPIRGPGFALDRPVAVQERRARRPAADPDPRRGVQPLQPGALQQPVGAISTPATFGQITSAQDGRVMQFGVEVPVSRSF